ncbi:hypothetical protein ACEQPO_11805 [Bacillus sp. SL00103]
MSEMRFRDEDFETFTVDGLDERMTVLKKESVQSLRHLENTCTTSFFYYRRRNVCTRRKAC